MLYAHNYNQVRDVCHRIKSGDADISELQQVADELRSLINDDKAAIVPVPGHEGDSTYMFSIAMLMNLPVYDVMRCMPHETLYSIKKKGKKVKPDMLNMYLWRNKINPDRHIYIIDLVYATGCTAKAAQACFDCQTEMLIYALSPLSKTYKQLKNSKQ